MLQTRLFSPPDQFVSDSVKKTKKWQEDCTNFFESLILFENRQIKTSYYNKMTNYNLKRGFLNMADVKAICDPHDLGMDNFPAKMEHKGLGNAKIDLLVGEHIKRKFDFNCIRSASDQIGMKELEDSKREKITQELMEIIQSSEADEEKIAKRLQDLQQFVNSPSFDIVERGANKILKYTYKFHDIKRLFDECFEDALIAAEEYIFTEYIGGELQIRRGDPRRVFTLMNGYSTDETGLEALVEISYYTLSSIIDMFHDVLTKEQLDSLRETRGTQGSYPYLTYPQIGHIGELAIPTDSLTAQQIDFMPLNDIETSLFSSYFDSRGNIRVLTCFWRSKRKVKIVKSFDDNGVEQLRPEHEKYKIKKELGEELVREEWINEWWKGYKIAADIYCGAEPFPFLSVNMDNISKQTCPVTIQYFNSGSSKAQSLMDILKPYDYLYDIFDFRRQILINLMLPDIVSFPTTMIPDNMDIHEYMNYITSTGFMPQDPTAEIITPKGQQAAGVFNTVTAQRLSSTQQGPIAVLTEVMNDIRNTMDIVSGVNDARQGINNPNDLVGTTQMARASSANSTEKWFSTNERFKQRVLKKVLDIQLNILRKNPKKLNYLLDDFTKAIITDEELDALMLADVDVMVSNSSDDAELLEAAKMIFQAGIQNGTTTPSDYFDIIKNESTSEAYRILKNREEMRAQREQQMEKMSNEINAQNQQRLAEIENRKLDIEEKKLEIKKYEIDKKFEADIYKAELTSLGFDEGEDGPDIIALGEQALKQNELLHKQRTEDNKTALELRRLASEKEEKDKDRKLEREQMANDEKIAKIQAAAAKRKAAQSKSKSK